MSKVNNNPTTATELTDQLLTMVVEKQEAVSRNQGELKALIEKANALAGAESVEAGTLWLKGDKLKAKLTRRVNVKYTDKAQLGELVGANEELATMFRVELRESGQKVEKWLVSPPEDQKEVAEAISEIREKTPGSVGIAVSPNV